ncbi:flippase, partial [Escherichia coli]
GGGGLIFFLISPFAVELLNITTNNYTMIQNSIIIVGLCIPVFLVNQLLMGIMEGEERFGAVNVQKVIANIFIAAMPAVFVYFNQTIIYAVIGLLFGRVIGMIMAIYIFRLYIQLDKIHFYKNVFYRLLKFGSWITISNIISPVMTISDRFILAHLMGANHIAFYTAPSEGIARLTIIPAALSRAIFPKLSYAKSKKERKKYQRLGYLVLMLTCLPVVLFVFTFSNDILRIWMGPEFAADEPTLILRILVVGFLFNALAQIPFSSIQAEGKSQYTAAIHLCELVPYIYLLFFMINKYGIIGVAYAWLARTLVDFVLLMITKTILDTRLKDLSINGG